MNVMKLIYSIFYLSLFMICATSCGKEDSLVPNETQKNYFIISRMRPTRYQYYDVNSVKETKYTYFLTTPYATSNRERIPRVFQSGTLKY